MDSERRKTVLEQISSARPGLDLELAEFVGEGASRDVVLVGDDWVFKLPRDDRAREGLEREARFLELVTRYVHMPVPKFQIENNLAAYRYMPGVPLTPSYLNSISVAPRKRLMQSLGHFLRELHFIPIDPAISSGLKPVPAPQTLEDWQGVLDRVRSSLYPHMLRHQREWVESHFAPVFGGRVSLDFEPAVIHSDLGVNHVLVDPYIDEMAGVVGFGAAGLGDPAIDLGTLIFSYGETLVRMMITAYPEARYMIDRARFWAGALEIQWALAGRESGDPSLQLAHLGMARDMLPPGSAPG